MRNLVLSAAFFYAAIHAAGAASPSAHLSLHDAATMSNADAANQPSVSFEATVTYFRATDHDLFVQDGDEAIYVSSPDGLKVQPGDRIQVEGTMRSSFRPYVRSSSVLVTGHAAMPKPMRAGFEQMIRGAADCRYVSIHAFIRSADLVPVGHSSIPSSYLRMTVDGGEIDANLNNSDEEGLKGLLDSEVELTGVASGHFDNKMQQTGVLLHISSLSDIKILKHSSSSPWTLPITAMGNVITGYHPVDNSQRMRVQGTITYYQPGHALVLQEGEQSLWIRTNTYDDLKVGERATAIGFPGIQNGFLSLNESEVHDSQIQAPIVPALSTWNDLALGGNAGRGHSFDLVAIEGKVVAAVRQETEDEYVLDADGRLFSAVVRYSGTRNGADRTAMFDVPLGARVRVTGICLPADANPFNGEVPFSILLRNTDDIDVVAQPPWLDVNHLEQIAGFLILAIVAMGIWAWVIERNNRRQIGSLAYVEKRRGGILEDINNSRPLAEILERITELVSARLRGAPCWCRIEEGATLGNRPKRLDSGSLRVTEKPIAARNGPALGTIYAAFDPRTKPSSFENDALKMAAELAKLAIETSRLYSDLVRRSEFDLLTDVQNRFAMERTLDSMIHDARQRAGIFGLIYIDLNDFKQVNDVYGHLVGDLYLQEVARRMKTQLRPGDALARLGGDEFVALIGSVRSRSEVEEIASRLESCFIEPFIGDGYVLKGSASFGHALYPEDATSADSLLSAADAAMYTAKHSRPGRKGRAREHDVAAEARSHQ